MSGLRWLANHEIDRQQWDHCINESPQCILYALSWYLDVVSPGWAGIVLQQQGKYVAVMPLPQARRLGFDYLRQPLFCQQLGIFSPAGILPAQAADFLQIVKDYYRYVANYHCNTENYADFALFSGSFQHELNTHHLDLGAGYARVFEGYHRDRKMNLKRARKAALQVVESSDIEPLISLFKTWTAHKIEGGVSESAYELLRKIHKELQIRNQCHLWYTRRPGGQISAGALFAIHKNKIIYLFNAASDESRKQNGRTLLIDRVIQQYAGQPMIFDFESPEQSTIAAFYESFGAVRKPFAVWQYNRLPLWLNLVKKTKFLILKKRLRY